MPKLQKVVAVPNINWNKYRFLPESRIVQQQAALNDLILQTKRSAYCVKSFSFFNSGLDHQLTLVL